jgi:hypothetical protein
MSAPEVTPSLKSAVNDAREGTDGRCKSSDRCATNDSPMLIRTA